jgi:hypothetical protein
MYLKSMLLPVLFFLCAYEPASEPHMMSAMLYRVDQKLEPSQKVTCDEFEEHFIGRLESFKLSHDQTDSLIYFMKRLQPYTGTKTIELNARARFIFWWPGSDYEFMCIDPRGYITRTTDKIYITPNRELCHFIQQLNQVGSK